MEEQRNNNQVVNVHEIAMKILSIDRDISKIICRYEELVDSVQEANVEGTERNIIQQLVYTNSVDDILRRCREITRLHEIHFNREYRLNALNNDLNATRNN
ncbi:hypothetical protein HDU92_008443 [Lobulomyces angularis]|nr:hypothetical protein HDU92_008443 [Lobulomyces angularis]